MCVSEYNKKNKKREPLEMTKKEKKPEVIEKKVENERNGEMRSFTKKSAGVLNKKEKKMNRKKNALKFLSKYVKMSKHK